MSYPLTTPRHDPTATTAIANVMREGKGYANGNAAIRGMDYSKNPYANYDPKQMMQDYTDWRQPFQTWITKVLIPIDDAAALREPTEPYVEIRDRDDKNVVVQWIDTTMRNYGDAVSAYIRVDEMQCIASEADNPMASEEDRAAAQVAARHDLQYQDEVMEGDLIAQIKWHLTYRGLCFEQHLPLSPEESDELEGMKVRGDVHDFFDVAFRTTVGQRLDRVIVQKRRLLGELPPSWQQKVPNKDYDLDDILYEYFDRYCHAAVYGTTLVKPLTPHGYQDSLGRCAVPITLYQHEPHIQRLGDVGPQASGFSMRGVWIGTPLVYSLLTEHVKRSRALTLAQHAARTGSVPLIVVKGLMPSRSDENEDIDFENGVLQLEDTPSSMAQFMVPPNAGPTLTALISAINQDLAAASVAPNILQGQTMENVPGVSQNGMTSWARAKAESLSLSLSRGLTNRESMRIGIYKQILVASTAREYKRAHGESLNLSLGQMSELMHDGVTMIAGGIEIDNLTFEHIRRVRVVANATNRMATEQEAQLGQSLSQVKSATGLPLFSMQDIREKYFHDPDPWQSERNALLEMVSADPNSPWSQLKTIRAMIDETRVMLGPEVAQQYEQQYQELVPVALDSAITQAITSMKQAAQNPQPPGGPPGPGPGGPPGGPPPGPPPPGPPPGPPPPPPGPPPMGPPMLGGPPMGPPPGPPPPMLLPPPGPPMMGGLPFVPPGGLPPRGLPTNFPPVPPQGPPPPGLGPPSPNAPPFLQQPMLPAGPPGLPM